MIMTSTLNKIYSFLKQEEATTSVEYAVMLALIILACIGAVVTLGGGANNLWGGNLNNILTKFAN